MKNQKEKNSGGSLRKFNVSQCGSVSLVDPFSLHLTKAQRVIDGREERKNHFSPENILVEIKI